MVLPEEDRVLTHHQISVLNLSLSQLEAVEAKLAGELDAIRCKISVVRDQRAALESRIAAVWSLPNELLAYIFELGVMEEQAMAEESADDDDGGDGDDDGAQDEGAHAKVGFQVLVSQVCRIFRAVAVRTPSLWTEIHVLDLEPSRLDFIRTCVERSGTSRLDILLDTENQYPGVEGGELAAFATLLAPHIARFRRFTLRLRGFSGLHFVMQALDRPAPQLETLELSDIDYDATFDEEEPFDPPELRRPLTLFEGATPQLRRLALDGAHVAWGASNFANLVELHLGYHTHDVRPAYADFAAILQASPALQSLELDGSAPLLADDAAAYAPVLLEQLADLTLANLRAECATALAALLRAPNVKYLALTDMDEHDDYSGLLRGVAGPPALFPALTALKLAALETDDAACEALLRAHPALTYLALYLGRMSLAWLELLEPRGGDGDGDAGGAREVLCPKLECLRCVGASTSDLKRVLEGRRDAGFGIARLELDRQSADWATPGSMEWIREHAEVALFEPSEHGSDDEDHDGSGSEWGTDDDGDSIGIPYFTMHGFSDIDMDESEEEEEVEGSEDHGSDIEVDGSDGSMGSGSDNSAHE